MEFLSARGPPVWITPANRSLSLAIAICHPLLKGRLLFGSFSANVALSAQIRPFSFKGLLFCSRYIIIRELQLFWYNIWAGSLLAQMFLWLSPRDGSVKGPEEESCKLHAVCRIWRGRGTRLTRNGRTNICWSGSSYKLSLWLPQMEQADNRCVFTLKLRVCILTTVNVPLMRVKVFNISSSLAEMANQWWISLSILLVISADVEGWQHDGWHWVGVRTAPAAGRQWPTNYYFILKYYVSE